MTETTKKAASAGAGSPALTLPEGKPLLSLAQMFGEEMDAEEAPARVAMPPLLAAVKRAARSLPIPALQGLTPFLVLRGRGGSGKTTFARWYASELFEREVARFVLAAMDPGVRLLAEFAEAVMQPPSTDPRETVAWLRTFLEQVRKHRAAGLLDTGGGDTSYSSLIRSWPTIVRDLEESGIGLGAIYFLSPSPDDPSMIGADADAGFAPRATALVCNLALADSPRAYDTVRAHADYKAALARGAVEIILPALEPRALANRIEARRFHFFQARDGIVPEGSRHAPIAAGMERTLVREWLEAMDVEMRPIAEAGWLPWSTAGSAQG
ncbi:P-loop NTPase family protein [Muricoccus vinaceus]|uniref:Uncharacterized protein n=1 Tax=Muricoccus vinaceus TaxID=424704 RepID=A0ABV6IZT5_9PROT